MLKKYSKVEKYPFKVHLEQINEWVINRELFIDTHVMNRD